jgi:hypothetical protein
MSSSTPEHHPYQHISSERGRRGTSEVTFITGQPGAGREHCLRMAEGADIIAVDICAR